MPKEPRQPEAFSLSKFFKNPIATLTGKNSKSDSSSSEKTQQQEDNVKFRRDFLYSSATGPLYFSTRAEFCLQASGGLFRAFDLLEYGPQHPLRGYHTTVVGERGGRLWTIDEGSQHAHPLHVTATSAKQLIKAKYGFKKIGENVLKPLTERGPQENATPAAVQIHNHVTHLLKTLPDLMVRVNDGRTMQHLTPMTAADGNSVGWAGVGYVQSSFAVVSNNANKKGKKNTASNNGAGKKKSNNNNKNADAAEEQLQEVEVTLSISGTAAVQ